MKKVIVILSALALFIGQQSYGQQPWKTHGNSINASDFLGTTNNMPLRFYTNNQQEMVILGNGHVGINDSTPACFLDVTGNAHISDTLTDNHIVTKNIMTPVGDSILWIGRDTDALGLGLNNIIAFGAGTTSFGNGCFPAINTVHGAGMGNGSTIARAGQSLVFGHDVQTTCTPTYAIVMGEGVPTGPALINTNRPSSLFVGFNSDIPTFYVGSSSGAGTIGKVGIGTTSPLTALHVATVGSQIGYITSDPLAAAGIGPLPNSDGLVIANNNGTMTQKLNFTGSSSDVLLGNGSFGSAASASNAWILAGNNNATLASKLGTTISVPLSIYSNNIQRMYLDPGVMEKIGIGNGFSAPQNSLHLNISTPQPIYEQWTNAITGNSAPNVGLEIGIDATGNADIIQNQANLPIETWENASCGSREVSRIITKNFIVNGAATNVTRMAIWNGCSINYNNDPLAMLQIGDHWPANAGGNRDWMNVGTYYNQSTDNMYVGERFLGINHSLAEIDWGNDPSSNPFIGDVLVFNFAAAINNGASSGYSGLEIARMWSNGNMARMGIGGWTQAGLGSAGTNNDYTGGGGTPGNTLEVNSPALTVGPLNSGLRFTDLNSTAAPVANPGAGVLAVNTNGDVIYVNENTGTGAGYCPNPTMLTGSAGYNLNNAANFYFSGNGAGTALNNVIIGNPCSYTPQAKLDVLQASGSTGSTGIYVENDDPPSSTGIVGFKAKLPTLTTSGFGVAGWFEAPWQTSGINIGYSIFVPPAPSTGTLPGIVSIGYSLGFLNSCNDLLQVASNIDANGVNVPSDRRYKTGINPLTDALNKIDSINPVYFYYDTAMYQSMGFSSRRQVGFIAQNVDSVLPEVVQKNDSGYYNLDYSRMTALLLAGEKEQQGIIIRDSLRNVSQQLTIDSLRTTLNSIEACISSLCDDTGSHHHHDDDDRMLGGSNGNTQNVTLSNAAILYQNTPNPFGTGGTKINYYLPQGTTGASIVFFDQYGNQLSQVQLTQTGMGSINVNPNRLSNGIYTYSLVINGIVNDTKKMVFAK